ncbi:GerMN domain-containing protein [Clostridium estertheticum]|uniref:GerMN domain-containing protein n=1 Tax=Clostridium estertheticum TaxID=238834 RepID=UPI0013EED87A|nr:GerMN domain-containing protein [Clostridium estertheticum]MBZ9608706.1 GerMN domain-containing protein [Clostridium estertheticum]
MKRIVSVILCSVVIFTLVACGKSEVKKEDPKAVTKVGTKEIPKEETKSEPKEEVKSSEVLLYFSDDQAMYLVGEKRNITKPTAKSIVEELVKGPSAKSEGAGKLYATLPVGAQVLDVQIKEHIAYVDFKGNLSEKMQGGSAGEGMALFSIINTLVLDKELGITKVQFLVDGKKVDTIKGHYDVSKPMSENKEMIKK